jgi:ribose transport system permease protein
VLTERGSKAALVAVLALEIGVFGKVAPGFLSVSNFLNAGSATSVLMVVAVGSTFGLISGALDISVGSTIALSGTVGTQLMVAGYPAFIAIPSAIATGLAVGLINGVAVVKLRVNPIVATLGTLGIARGIAYILDEGTGAVVAHLTPDPLYNVMQKDILNIPFSLIFAALFAFVAWVVLSKTRLGQYAYAIGGNSDSARAAAIPVDRLRILYLVLSGVTAATAGWALSSILGGSAANVAVGWELTIITAVILGGVGLAGGTGNMVGTVLGVTILGIMVNGMTLAGWQTFYQLIAQGLLLLIAVGLDAARTGGYR